ncbi:MAG: cation-translocating P-type ATPase [Polyangiaceae bacterium]|nr:cation-translocating P-type ATPase [Polyangiaceae bacterium]
MPPPRSAPEPVRWHTLPEDEVTRRLGVDPRAGLSARDHAARLARHGPNALAHAPSKSLIAMLGDQLRDFMVLVLIAAAIVSGLVGELSDTLPIVVIVGLNATLGVVQERRAARALEALRELAAPSARVLRGGEVLVVATEELVPGDVVLLEAGNLVPADLRLVEVASLRIAEAALTGEADGVDKVTHALTGDDLPLGDRANLAFRGTLVTYGRAVGVAVATGAATEVGRIAGLLAAGDAPRTPLQRRLEHFGRRLAWAVLALCAALFVAGLARGEEPVRMFLTSVSLAVAAIPEALPAVVTIALALGARRMSAHGALVRRLPAVETLGSITTIGSDKTGTLTENRMQLEALHVAGRRWSAQEAPGEGEPWTELFRALALSNDVTFSAAGEAVGEPTEVALAAAALAHGHDRRELARRLPRVAELPFDAVRKRMATLHATADGAVVAYVKGAPEAVLPLCSSELAGALDRDTWQRSAEELAASGLRVLAIARRTLGATPEDVRDAEQELELLGLVGLVDPPRPGVAQAVAECRTAGVVPIMITGDHPITARAIARRIGIVEGEATVLTGPEVAALDDARLAARLEDARVFARVDPAQKHRIVSALQARGEIVAMTGDGVNDAPALERADIGVAMGRGGTDVAREAAHMVLTDDDFTTLVRAIREGRRIYDNVRKFIRYTMTSNTGEIVAVALAPAVGLPIALLPIHILWINLVTDGLPGLALAEEPAERDVMRRPPRSPTESVFAHGMWRHIVGFGALMGGVSLLAQALAATPGRASSLVFTVLCLAQLGHALAIRSERTSLFALGLRSNRTLTWVVAGSVGLQLATLYVPPFGAVFHTVPLTVGELALAFALASAVFIGVEFEKLALRKFAPEGRAARTRIRAAG